MPFISHFRCAVAALLCVPAAVLSQDVPRPTTDSVRASTPGATVLRAVTITATRTVTDVRNVAAAVLVIDSLRIRSQLANGVADLLRSEAGVDVVGTGVNQVRPTIRGQRGQRILLLEDGMRLNNSRISVKFRHSSIRISWREWKWCGGRRRYSMAPMRLAGW